LKSNFSELSLVSQSSSAEVNLILGNSDSRVLVSRYVMEDIYIGGVLQANQEELSFSKV